MAVQQCKVSKRRIRARKAANRYKGLQTSVCSNCNEPALSHRVCPSCGFYKGRQIVSVTVE